MAAGLKSGFDGAVVYTTVRSKLFRFFSKPLSGLERLTCSETGAARNPTIGRCRSGHSPIKDQASGGQMPCGGIPMDAGKVTTNNPLSAGDGVPRPVTGETRLNWGNQSTRLRGSTLLTPYGTSCIDLLRWGSV